MICEGAAVKYPIAFQLLKDKKKELLHDLIQKGERISNLYKQIGVDVPKEFIGSEVYLNL